MNGFVFAFYRYSRLQHATFLERLVHVATGDDAIHVAIIPAMVLHRSLYYCDVGYTAFIGNGVMKQPADEVMRDKNYACYFVPTPHDKEGGAFLESVVGIQYNGVSLFSTLLPMRMKRSIPEWISHENDAKMPGKRPALFCSQLGLMLCTIIGVTDGTMMDPAACSPGDLERFVIKHASHWCHDPLHGVWSCAHPGIATPTATPFSPHRSP